MTLERPDGYTVFPRRGQAPMPSTRPLTRPVFALIAGAIVIWGAITAIGVYRVTHSFATVGIVAAAIVAFLSMWLFSMWRRHNRARLGDQTPAGDEPRTGDPHNT